MRFKLGDYVRLLVPGKEGIYTVGRIVKTTDKVRDYLIYTRSPKGNKVKLGVRDSEIEPATEEMFQCHMDKFSPTKLEIVSVCALKHMPEETLEPQNWKKVKSSRQGDKTGTYWVNRYECSTYFAKVYTLDGLITDILVRHV